MKQTGVRTGRRQAAWLILLAAVFAMLLAVLSPDQAHAASLKLNKKKIVLALAGPKTANLHVTASGVTVRAKFSSSSKRVATVNREGRVTAKRTGSCWITAKYGKKKVKCKIVVKKKMATYSKSIKKYKDFLKHSYVTYQIDGSRDQADNFYSLDLDGNAIPELLTCVVSGPDRLYVLYHYKGGRISVGQMMGAATAIKWYPRAQVLAYRTWAGGKSYYHYARFDGTRLADVAWVTVHKRKTTYTVRGRDVDVLAFRSFVDHDLLDYEGGQDLVAHVNTPYNRSVFLK